MSRRVGVRHAGRWPTPRQHHCGSAPAEVQDYAERVRVSPLGPHQLEDIAVTRLRQHEDEDVDELGKRRRHIEDVCGMRLRQH